MKRTAALAALLTLSIAVPLAARDDVCAAVLLWNQRHSFTACTTAGDAGAATVATRHASRRWIAIKTIIDPRSEWQGAEVFYGTFRNAVEADVFCQKLIASARRGAAPMCRCTTRQLVRPGEVKVTP